MKRICILGKWESYLSHFLIGSLQGAYLNNCLCRPVSIEQNGEAIKEQLDFFKPHILLCHTIFDRDTMPRNIAILSWLRKNGCKVFYHAGDARGSPRYPYDISRIVDYVLINHWPPLHTYNVWKVPMFHWPYFALNQSAILQPQQLYRCSLAFVGSLANNEHHAPRAKFINHIKNKIPISLFPTQQTGNTRFQTAELSGSADGVLGFQMGLNIPGYLDVRPWQFIGAGALYFHDHHPHMDKFFTSGEHYVGFERDNVQDFIIKFEHYTKSEENIKIRKAGFEYCQEYHNSKSRIKGVLDIYNGKEYKIHCLR